MSILNYATKKELKGCVGQRLNYTETSRPYSDFTENGEVFGSNRPSLSRNGKREFYATVTMKNGLIEKVQ